jgi:protein Mpv17
MAAPRLHRGMFFNRALLRSSVSVGTLMLTGDAIAQQYEGRSARSRISGSDHTVSLPGERQWNVTRSGRMATIGVMSAGPLSHWTYVACSHCFPGTAWPQIGKRVLAVVILQAPVQIHMTFGLTILLAGGTLLEVTKKLREDFLKTWAINNCFWPPVLAVNMKFVALNNQAVVGGVGHAFWNVFLAYMANRSTISPHEGEATAVADATAALAQASKN